MNNSFNNVFPTLVGTFELNDVDNEILMNKMDMSGNVKHGLIENGVSSYVGGEDCFLTRLNVVDLKEQILFHLNEYCFQSGIAPNLIINSWANVLEQKGLVKRHRHEKSIISGAYYPQDSDANLILENPNTIFQMTQTNINESIYNTEKILIKPKAGLLVMWPSYIFHYTESNDKEKRYTVSFNTLDESYKSALNRR